MHPLNVEANILKRIGRLLQDGCKGFTEIGAHLKDPSTKAIFLEEASIRRQFEQELRAHALILQEVGGTTLGAMHRTWGDIEAHLGAGDLTLLETVVTGEATMIKAYREALADAQLTALVRLIFERQLAHILSVQHNFHGPHEPEKHLSLA